MYDTSKPKKIDKYGFIKQWLNRVWLIRTICLIVSALLGVCLALWWFVDEAWLPSLYPFGEVALFKKTIGMEQGRWLDSSLTTIFLALPTLFVLWLFRTNDTREQIEKTNEQIENTQNNTLTSILTHAMDMITSDDLRRRSTGLIQLGLFKKQTDKYNAQIDSATRNIDLTPHKSAGVPLSNNIKILHKYKKALLKKAALKGMDLSGAKLSGANLQFADLIGTDLTNVDLVDADLTDADLTDADLKGATFDDAKYNDKTIFPDGFDPKAAGMIKINH